MGARSRRKGARAELEVCRLFQRALGGKWSRVPLSGGWANRAEFHTCGDVITTLPDFPFTIEVKCVEGWHLEQLLTSPDTCSITTWWRQACRQATEAGKKPLLVFTRNFEPLFAMVRSSDVPAGVTTTLPRANLRLPAAGVEVWVLEGFLEVLAHRAVGDVVSDAPPLAGGAP